jgi:ribonuclease Z
MNFELTILGSGSALPTSRRYPTAHALNVHERFFLIDCGEGTQLQLRKAKINLGRLDHIFISHLHGDHIYGLFGLLSTLNLLGRKSDLFIFGPPDLQKIIDFFLFQLSDGLQYKIIVTPNVSRSYSLIYSNKHVDVFAFPLKHRVPTWGYLFKEKEKELNIHKEVISDYNLSIKDIVTIKKGADFSTPEGEIISNKLLTTPPTPPRSFAFCSDTAYYDRITKWIKGVDILYHEATFANADKSIAKKTGHSTTQQAATIAKKAHVKKLIIGHFSNRYKEPEQLLTEARQIFQETYLAEDLETYSVNPHSNN